MKKTYIIPSVSEMDLAVENIIAASLPVGGDTTTTPFSQKRSGGWSADEWTAEEEE